MKKTHLIFLIPLFFACSQSNSDNWEAFEVKIDTVFIEAGDEIIFLQSGLSHSSLSLDQKKLFNFSPKSELEIIDLDNLKLLNKIVTEKEGVLGTGWPYAIQFEQTGNLVFYGLNEVRLLKPDLSSMQRYSVNEEDLAGIAPEVLAMFNPKVTDGNLLYGIYENSEQVPMGLAIVSLEDKNVKKIPLEMAERIVPFTFSLFVQGRLSNRAYDPINLVLVNNQLIISTAYSNDAFILDLKSETVALMTFHSELTQDKTAVPNRTSAETINELEGLMKEKEKSVKFGPIYFDKTHERFCRFSRQLDREIGDSIIFKSVLTVFDKDLNQLGEQVVQVDPFSKKFFKDGKLWSYVNVEDELGFAVFTFDF
jgi:hypothetical protein